MSSIGHKEHTQLVISRDLKKKDNLQCISMWKLSWEDVEIRWFSCGHFEDGFFLPFSNF